jgi:hypothetical protein
VNILADKALLAAFADNVYQVTPKHVKAAIQDSEFAESSYGQRFWRYKQFATWFICLLVILIVVSVAVMLWKQTTVQKTQPNIAKSSTIKSSPSQGARQSAVAVTNTKMGVNDLSSLTNAGAPAVLKDAAITSDKSETTESKNSAGLVSQRLDAMNRLLQNAKPDTVLLQIKSVPNALPLGVQGEERQLAMELERLSQQVEADNIYLYRMHQKDGLYTVVLYGAYEQRADALDALKNLPPYLKNSRPYMRTLAGIGKDIAITP